MMMRQKIQNPLQGVTAHLFQDWLGLGILSVAVEHLLIDSVIIFCMPTMCARQCVRDAANIAVDKV